MEGQHKSSRYCSWIDLRVLLVTFPLSTHRECTLVLEVYICVVFNHKLLVMLLHSWFGWLKPDVAAGCCFGKLRIHFMNLFCCTKHTIIMDHCDQCFEFNPENKELYLNEMKWFGKLFWQNGKRLNVVWNLLQISVLFSDDFCHLLFLLRILQVVCTGRHNSIVIWELGYGASNVIWFSYSLTCQSFRTVLSLACHICEGKLRGALWPI